MHRNTGTFWESFKIDIAFWDDPILVGKLRFKILKTAEHRKQPSNWQEISQVMISHARVNHFTEHPKYLFLGCCAICRLSGHGAAFHVVVPRRIGMFPSQSPERAAPPADARLRKTRGMSPASTTCCRL